MMATSLERPPAACRFSHGSERRPSPADDSIGAELRDGLLQDLLAIGMLVRAARGQVAEGASEADGLLGAAAERLHTNVCELRAVIERLADEGR